MNFAAIALLLLVGGAPSWAIERPASSRATSLGLTTNPANCGDGEAGKGIDTTGAAEGCVAVVPSTGGVITGDLTTTKINATQVSVTGGILGSGVLQITGDSTQKKIGATQVDVSGGILGSGVLQITGDSTQKKIAATQVEVSGGVLGSSVLQITGDTTLKKVAATQAEISGGVLGSGILDITGDSTLKKLAATQATVSGGILGSGILDVTGDSTLKKLTATQAEISGGVLGSGILDITGVTSLRAAVTVAGSSLTVAGAGAFGIVGSTNATLVVRSTSTNATHPVIRVEDDDGTYMMEVQKNGRVGIGVNGPVIPSVELEIFPRVSNRSALNINSAPGDAGSPLITCTGTDQCFGFGIDGSGSVYGLQFYYQNTTRLMNIGRNGGLQIGTAYTNDAPANGLTVSGNVGIGNSSPQGLLHVSSGAVIIDGNAATPFKIGTSSFSIDSAGKVTTSSSVIAGLTISTESAGLAGVAVTALCPAGTFAMGGGCDCTEGTTPTDYRSEPNNLTAGGQATGWTCEQNGSVGGLCAARVICSRLQ